jgi:hypothetical protein
VPCLLREPSADAEDALAHETIALDVALASGHGGVINHDNVCGLLIEWLRDVSSAILAIPYLFALLLGFLFLFLSMLGEFWSLRRIRCATTSYGS